MTTIAGGSTSGLSVDGTIAATAALSNPRGIEVAPDGALYIADAGTHRVQRVKSVLPTFSGGDLTIPSRDGSVLYRFDANGRHLNTVHGLTGATLLQFGYDSAGHIASIRDANGNITTIEHDANGNPTAIVGPFGQRNTLVIGGNGFLASVTNPAGEAYSMTYSAEGLLAQFTDPRGNPSTMTYDSLGRLISDQNAAGGNLTLARTEINNGHVVSQKTALNRVTTHEIGSLPTGNEHFVTGYPDGTKSERLIAVDGSLIDIFPNKTIVGLVERPDPRFGMLAPLQRSQSVSSGGLSSQLVTERTVNLADPNNPLSLTTLTDTVTVNGRTATSVFDAATKTATSTSAAGRHSTATIDAQGRITEAQVAGLLPVNSAYDLRGRPSSITQGTLPDTRTVSFSYNPQGFLDTVTDPLNRILNYQYDAAGRVTRETLPDGRFIQYSYDAKGNLASLTPPGKLAHLFRYTTVDQTAEYDPPAVGAGTNATVYSYNVDRDLTSIARPDGQTVNFIYDNAGRLSSLDLGLTPLDTYTYNATTGKLTSITEADGGTLSYAYNGALLTSVTWAGTVAGSVGRSYDNDFRVTSLTVNGADPVNFGYDADSLFVQAGGLSLTRSAQNGLLTGTGMSSGTDTTIDGYSYDGFGEVTAYSAKFNLNTLFNVNYTYDALGRITRKAEAVNGVVNTFDYAYDTAGRLSQVTRNNIVTASYSYDSNGNRTAGPGLTTPPNYDDQDRLLQYGGKTYTYTANGELLTKTDGGAVTTYGYDVLGNLKTVALPGSTTPIEYLVDGNNRRIGKKVNGILVQGFLYQDQLKPIAELDGTGTVVSRFVYATHANVPDYMVQAGVTYRLVTDHLGSVRLVVNTADGSIAQRMDYDEFGNVIRNDINLPGFHQPFGFAGGLYDPDTRLVRFGARDYDAETGRWTVGFGGGDWDLYSYVMSNPLNNADLIGLLSERDQPAYAVIARKPLFPGAWGSYAPGFDPTVPSGPGDFLNTELSHKHIFVYNDKGELIDNFGYGPQGPPYVVSPGVIFTYPQNDPALMQFVPIETLSDTRALKKTLKKFRSSRLPWYVLYWGLGHSCQNFAEDFSTYYHSSVGK